MAYSHYSLPPHLTQLTSLDSDGGSVKLSMTVCWGREPNVKYDPEWGLVSCLLLLCSCSDQCRIAHRVWQTLRKALPLKQEDQNRGLCELKNVGNCPFFFAKPWFPRVAPVPELHSAVMAQALKNPKEKPFWSEALAQKSVRGIPTISSFSFIEGHAEQHSSTACYNHENLSFQPEAQAKGLLGARE